MVGHTFYGVVVTPSKRTLALCGLLFDGLFLGWTLSPYKIWKPYKLNFFEDNTLMVVLLFTWILGVFLSSVGINLVVAWILLLLALWAYLQLKNDRNKRMTVSA
jgi:hypothetical protein